MHVAFISLNGHEIFGHAVSSEEAGEAFLIEWAAEHMNLDWVNCRDYLDRNYGSQLECFQDMVGASEYFHVYKLTGLEQGLTEVMDPPAGFKGRS